MVSPFNSFTIWGLSSSSSSAWEMKGFTESFHIHLYIFCRLDQPHKKFSIHFKPKPHVCNQNLRGILSVVNKQGKDVKAFQVTLEMNHHSSSRSFSNSNEKVFPWVADVWFLLLLLLITLALPAEEDFLKTPSRIVVFPTSALSLFARDFNFFCR